MKLGEGQENGPNLDNGKHPLAVDSLLVFHGILSSIH